MNQPTPRHQDVVGVLFAALRFARGQGLGRAFLEPLVVLPDGRGYVPDVAFLSAGRMDLLPRENGPIHSTNLVVEVTSSQPARDRVHKFRTYYGNQVPWYWIIDPETLDLEEYRTARPPKATCTRPVSRPRRGIRTRPFPRLDNQSGGLSR